MVNSVTNMLKKDKVKLLIGGDLRPENQTVQNFNSINGGSRSNNVSNPAIILKQQISEVRVPSEPNSSSGANRKVTMRTNRVNSTSMGQNSNIMKKVNGGAISSARNSSSSKQPVNLKKKIVANSSLSQNLK